MMMMMMLMMVGGSRRVFGVFFFPSTLGMIWVTMKEASDGQTALIESSQQLKSKVIWVVR
jgi:membrane protein insertase Oxa1/YidC/SpoIIIJ